MPPQPTDAPELVLDAGTELGEGPIWDQTRQRLLFVDIMRGHVHEFDPATRHHRVVDAGQPVGAVAPTVRGDWIVAAQRGFFRLDPDSGRTTLVAEVEVGLETNRMNDGYVDSQGRFWAGTMDMTERAPTGALYRLDPDCSVHRMLDSVTISNGIDWSPDDHRAYYIDTPTRRLDVLDFDAEAGTVTNRRPLVTFADDQGSPDGLVVDAEGFVWVGLFGGWALHRYAPDGRLERAVRFPTARVTKCAFGGPELKDLYATTAFIGFDADERARQPLAGGLFRMRPGVAGRPSHRFAG